MVIKSVSHIRISHLARLPERIKELLIIRQHQQPIMIRHSKEERIRILEVYMRTFSVAEVQRDFRIQFHTRTSPSKNTIKSLYRKFTETGSVSDRSRCGRLRSIRTEAVINIVSADVAANPKSSIRKRSTQLSVSRSSLQRILRSELKLYPYKIQLIQEITANDPQQRLEYAESFLHLCEEASFIDNVIFSDEAHFYLSGHVNRHNSRIWSNENPQEIQERPLHSPRVTVWCGITASTVFGPYFFESDDGTTSTVNGERYRIMIREFLIPRIKRQRALRNTWFQQDGATSHTARETMALLKKTFPNRLISRFGNVSWPPRSPDLTPADFFLWGYLKSKVYVTNPSNLQELKDNITHQIVRISPDTLRKVMQNTVKRAQSCRSISGHHLKDIVFKK